MINDKEAQIEADKIDDAYETITQREMVHGIKPYIQLVAKIRHPIPSGTHKQGA